MSPSKGKASLPQSGAYAAGSVRTDGATESPAYSERRGQESVLYGPCFSHCPRSSTSLPSTHSGTIPANSPGEKDSHVTSPRGTAHPGLLGGGVPWNTSRLPGVTWSSALRRRSGFRSVSCSSPALGLERPGVGTVTYVYRCSCCRLRG